jgi:hypothetical protein
MVLALTHKGHTIEIYRLVGPNYNTFSMQNQRPIIIFLKKIHISLPKSALIIVDKAHTNHNLYLLRMVFYEKKRFYTR